MQLVELGSVLVEVVVVIGFEESLRQRVVVVVESNLIAGSMEVGKLNLNHLEVGVIEKHCHLVLVVVIALELEMLLLLEQPEQPVVIVEVELVVEPVIVVELVAVVVVFVLVVVEEELGLPVRYPIGVMGLGLYLVVVVVVPVAVVVEFVVQLAFAIGESVEEEGNYRLHFGISLIESIFLEFEHYLDPMKQL